MSIFFKGERHHSDPVIPPPTPTQKDQILALLADKQGDHEIVSQVGVAFEIVRYYRKTAREIEPQVIEKLASGELTTKTAAVQFVADYTDQFPAAKYIQQMIDNCTPSTFTGLVAACQEEVA